MNKKLKTFKKHLDFLEDNKSIVGLSDWTIKINTKEKPAGATIAQVIPDILEQELTIYLSEYFLKTNIKEQHNILLHELLHARLLIYQLEKDKAGEVLEEKMINDLTRGIEKLL